jgi:hypothetical protein
LIRVNAALERGGQPVNAGEPTEGPMRKYIIATVAGLMALTTVQARADPLDDQLKNRGTMVAMVALLLHVPDKCLIDHKTPSGERIARFIMAYGHRADDALVTDVQAKIKLNDDMIVHWSLSEQEKAKFLDTACAMSIIMSSKVRDSNK